MSEKGKTAYITGGASGIGLALATTLAEQGVNLYVADRNLEGVQKAAKHLSETHDIRCIGLEVDVASWEQQADAFREATKKGRVDYVFPIAGIGEKTWVKNDPGSKEGEYEEPNLAVIDVDLKGVLYTSSLAIQHFRRQEADSNGIRGKIITVASVCGLYCVPTLPIYTAAKHGVVGFTRSYGVRLLEEGITLNAICPNIVRTAISSEIFYSKVSEAGVLVPIEDVITAVEGLLGSDKRSGECIEVGPQGTRETRALEPMDQASRVSCELLHERARPLHAVQS